MTSLPTFVPLVAANHTLCPSRSGKHHAAAAAGNPPIPAEVVVVVVVLVWGEAELKLPDPWPPEIIANIAFTFGQPSGKSEGSPSWADGDGNANVTRRLNSFARFDLGVLRGKFM